MHVFVITFVLHSATALCAKLLNIGFLGELFLDDVISESVSAALQTLNFTYSLHIALTSSNVMSWAAVTLSAWSMIALIRVFVSDPGTVRRDKFSNPQVLRDPLELLVNRDANFAYSECRACCNELPFTVHTKNHCVFKFDHSCNWCANDIGCLNRAYFVSFLVL